MSEENQQQETQNEAETVQNAQAAEAQAENIESAGEDKVEISPTAEWQAKLDAMALEVKKAQETVKYTLADMENLRRRTAQDVEKARAYGIEKFAEELVPVIDALEKSLEHMQGDDEQLKSAREGIEMTCKQFMTVAEKHGLKQINPLNQPFDPNVANAIQMVDAPEGVDPNTVINVFQKGYTLNGRTIRAAMVVVSKPKPIEVNA